jgi:hypothetical protein
MYAWLTPVNGLRIEQIVLDRVVGDVLGVLEQTLAEDKPVKCYHT